MRHIVYLNNYIGSEIISLRNNKEVCAQASNNKIRGILKAMRSVGYEVTILSSGLVSSKSKKWYDRYESSLEDSRLIYCGIFDYPLLSTLSSAYDMYREIKRVYKEKPIDNIVFYNFKPEVALAAIFAKWKLKIPITVEYEDGYSDLFPSFKTLMLKSTERIVKPRVNSAIVVNKLAKQEFKVPCITIRGVVDPEYRRKCLEYTKKENRKFTILYSGGFNEKRGIYVLIDSLKYLDFDCEVLITGGKQLNIDDSRVKVRGFLEYEEVQSLMMQADLLVQCQLTKCSFANQSFPSKLFEYLPTGNAIVSSDIHDVRDFAGDAFIYYSDDDSRELAKAITEAYVQWERGTNLNRNKLSQLCDKNLPENIGTALMELFN